MSKFKFISTTFIALVLSVLLTGCGNEAASQNTSDNASEVSVTVNDNAAANEAEGSAVSFCDIFKTYKGEITDAAGNKQAASLKISFSATEGVVTISSVADGSKADVEFTQEQLARDNNDMNLSVKDVMVKFSRIDGKINLIIKSPKLNFTGVEDPDTAEKPVDRPISCNVYSNAYTVYGGGAATEDGKQYSDVKIGVTYLKDKNVILIKPISHEFLATAEIKADGFTYQFGNYTSPKGSVDEAYFFNQGGDKMSVGLVIKGKDGQPYNFLGATWLK